MILTLQLTRGIEMENQTAKTIIEQMGGNKFAAMTGAKNFVASEDGLQFSIPKTNKINKVVIELNANDLYNVSFWNIQMGANFKMDKISEETNIYADTLRSVFTAGTGLDTHL